MNIRERFDKAIEQLYKSNHYLAAEITKLGYPKLIPANAYPPTAGVAWDKDKKKISFLFNERFAETLNDEEFMFTIAHESIHVINMHIFLFRDEADKMKKKNKSDKEIFGFIRKLNIAADCVVNDSLTRLYEFPRLKELGELPVHPMMKKSKKEEKNPGVELLYGENIIKVDCDDMTVMEVYALLPEDPLGENGKGDPENHEGWQSFMNEDGSLNKDFVDAVKDFVENSTENSALSDEEASEVDKMRKDMRESMDHYTAQAGKNVTGNLRPIDGLSRDSINWNRILFQLTDAAKPEEIWHRPNRKLTYVYPDVILPSVDVPEKEEIFVAIDTSSSMSRQAVDLLANVVRNTPQHFKVKAITFDTWCHKYDIKSNKITSGGGTNFGIIEQYIINNFKKYPKAVFVLTDGEGSPVEPKYPKRWCFLLYSPCSTIYCKGMKHYKLFDLLK